MRATSMGVATLVAVINLASPARAGEPKTFSPWPDGVSRFHLVAGGSFGWFSRQDADVEASGAAFDVALGFDMALPARTRIAAEIGLQDAPRASTGDSSVLAAKAASGERLFARVLFGYDLTRLFFARIGFELDEGIAFRTFVTGPKLVFETGTRAFRCVELGFRFHAGGDGVLVQTASGASFDHEALSFGIVLFTRVFVR